MLEILQYIGRAFLQAVDIFVCLIGRGKYVADARFNLGRNFYDIGKFLLDGIHTGSNLIGLCEDRIKGTLDIRDLLAVCISSSIRDFRFSFRLFVIWVIGSKLCFKASPVTVSVGTACISVFFEHRGYTSCV